MRLEAARLERNHGRRRPPECRCGRASRGMTLLELMIVVVVIGLLGAIALPAYQSSVRKAHRAEARTALTTAAQRLERFYTENSRYDTATVGTASTDTISPKSENEHYLVSLDVAADVRNAYKLTATPQGAQASDGCGKFTLDQSGKRDVAIGAALSAAECW